MKALSFPPVTCLRVFAGYLFDVCFSVSRGRKRAKVVWVDLDFPSLQWLLSEEATQDKSKKEKNNNSFIIVVPRARGKHTHIPVQVSVVAVCRCF